MNNLQVCLPYQPCVYRCPMCVARGHKHEYKFENLYSKDFNQWANLLHNRLARGDIDNIVITGECDPTQNIRFVTDTLRIIRALPPSWDGNVEITTHNQKYASVFRNLRPDVISLSATNAREYLSSWQAEKPNYLAKHYRLVILLTDEFNFLTPENFSPMGFDQVTFKTLQYGEDGVVNRWIFEHKMDDEHLKNIQAIVDKFNSNGSVSVRLDTSCQTAEGRYEIFRCDGKIYPSWEATEETTIDAIF